MLGPAGQSADATLEQIAPGRFGGRVAVGPTGRYTATLRVGAQTLRRTVLHTADHEFLPSAGPALDLAALVREDLITAWRPGADLSAGLERGQWPLRLPMLTLVSVLYILLLIHGRTGWPLGPLRRYLKARLSKIRGSESGALVGRWFARRPSG